MKQLTIRGVDDRLHQRLRERAGQAGRSVNWVVLGFLRRAVGLAGQEPEREWRDLDDLAGTWSEEEAAEMTGILAGLRRVEEELWR